MACFYNVSGEPLLLAVPEEDTQNACTVAYWKEEIARARNAPKCLLEILKDGTLLEDDAQIINFAQNNSEDGAENEAESLSETESVCNNTNIESESQLSELSSSREGNQNTSLYSFVIRHSDEFKSRPFVLDDFRKNEEYWTQDRVETFIFQREYESLSGAGERNFWASASREFPKSRAQEMAVLAFERWPIDDEVAKVVVENSSYALRFASDRLKDCEEVVKVAVGNDGFALRWASDRLKDSEEVVKVAVGNWGDALEHASDRLKDCEEMRRNAYGS